MRKIIHTFLGFWQNNEQFTNIIRKTNTKKIHTEHIRRTNSQLYNLSA